MNPSATPSWKVGARGAAGILVVLAVWQGFALSGMFSSALTPALGSIATTIIRMLGDGTLVKNALYTMARVLIGFGISFAIAVPLGILMGRYWLAERFFLPLVSVLLPIPSVAWIPLFVLWFGIGNTATTLVVIYAAFFPLVYNAWRGVKAVNPLWLRAAKVAGASRSAMFFKVIIPGTMPYIVTGARLAVGHAWIGVIGGELLASPKFGLGEVIFDAKEYLQSGIMISALITIGILGFLSERFVFQVIEAMTVQRWGMATSTR
ncbi:MAG: ABC transporter permease [Acetobacteraceae bacterium]